MSCECCTNDRVFVVSDDKNALSFLCEECVEPFVEFGANRIQEIGVVRYQTLSFPALAIFKRLGKKVKIVEKTATISRGKIYHRGGKFAWTWLYTVHTDGEYNSSGPLNSCRELAKRRGATKIVEAWKEN